MKKLRAKCSEWMERANTAPIGKPDWILLLVMAAFMLVTMFYADMVIIYNHSLTFLDSFFGMDMANFYANTLEKPYMGFGAVYYWQVYAVIGIWNLPIWILSKIFHINVFSVKCLLWCRLEVVFFLILTLYMLEKIMKDFGFGKEKYRFVQFMFASSLMVILPTIAISQIDIITVFLMLWGIREYLNTDKITWKFLLIFSFAACMKIFALFVFIPLVLLREKRILSALWDLFVGTWFILLGRLPYMGREDYKQATSILMDVMTDRMFETTFTAGNVEIPAFLSILIAICIWAYMTKIEGRNQYFYYTNWIALAALAAFFMFVHVHPYWIVLMAPYLLLILVCNPDRMKLNVILEFCAGAAVTFFYCTSFGVYMGGDTFSYLLLPRLGFEPKNTGYNAGLGAAVRGTKGEMYFTILFAAFVVCMIAFLIINRPWKENRAEVWADELEQKLVYDHGMIYLRLLCILLVILGSIYFSYIY